MKSKSYFVDRIIKLRGGEGDKDELMKLQMVDILHILNEERLKHKKPEKDDIIDMLPNEKDEDEPEEEEKKEEVEEEKKEEVEEEKKEEVEEEKKEEVEEEKKEEVEEEVEEKKDEDIEEIVKEKEDSDSDSDEESMISIIKRFLIKSKDKRRD
jgi:hypothetical protein